LSFIARCTGNTTLTSSGSVEEMAQWRCEVYETAKLRDSSMFSFATRREAQTDAELFIEKLVATWQRSNDKPPKPRDI
jgi:hypothetical protein